MKGSLRRALALLVAIMMVSTCMPLTALAEIIEASGSVQPFRVIQPDQGVYVTFEFYNGDEKVDTQIVTNGLVRRGKGISLLVGKKTVSCSRTLA